MGNLLFNSGRQAFLRGTIDWNNAAQSVGVALIDTNVLLINPDNEDEKIPINTVNFSTLADLRNGTTTAIKRRSEAPTSELINRTSAGGVADAADFTFYSVPAMNEIDALVLFLDTGDEDTDTLLVYIDSGNGLPITPNGSDILIRWDNGPNKIFKL